MKEQIGGSHEGKAEAVSLENTGRDVREMSGPTGPTTVFPSIVQSADVLTHLAPAVGDRQDTAPQLKTQRLTTHLHAEQSPSFILQAGM